MKCVGCKQEISEVLRSCPNCREYLYEQMASTLDKSYDCDKMNNWSEAWAILRKLWCWPALLIDDPRYTDDILNRRKDTFLG